MPERGAGLKAKGGALEDGAVEGLRCALEKRRGLPALGHHDARQTVGRHALGHGECHLLLEVRLSDHSEKRRRILCGLDDSSLCGGRSNLRFENVSS